MVWLVGRNDIGLSPESRFVLCLKKEKRTLSEYAKCPLERCVRLLSYKQESTIIKECVTNSGECNMIDSLSIATDFFVKLFNCAIVQLIIGQVEHIMNPT